MSQVYVEMPVGITQELIQAVKNDPTTSVEDKEEWFKRLGWLACAYEVMVEAQRQIAVSRQGVLPQRIMVVCETCGNKRCPHATDENTACTNSNAVGQSDGYPYG